MTEDSVKQLTFLRWDSRCPICKKMINQKKRFNIELHDSNRQIFIDGNCELHYCDHCDLPLIDGKIISSIYRETGMRPTTFSTEKKSELDKIKKQMYYKMDSGKEYRVIGKSTSIWKPYKRLYSANGQDFCHDCLQQLIKGETIIPIGENSNLLVEGIVCPKCKSMFIKDADDISKILKDNPHSEGFYINDIAYWQYSELEKKKKQAERKRQKEKEARARYEIQRQRMRNILDSIESSVVLISVKFQEGSTAEYIITTNNTSVSAENAIHYSSTIGRELLTAACVSSRKKRGRLNGKNYRVNFVFPKNKMPETLIPSSITIKTDGGYSSSVKNRRREIVDLLLYSPYNDIYECVHATYDKKNDICFMDVGIFRRFIKEFGNPGLWLDFPRATSAMIGELNEESVLRGYGYSVDKKENLSSVEREELLTELVDLEILTVAKIVHHLDFCIRLRTDPRYTEAISKWTSDKEFIENYNVNPERFMLCQKNIMTF